MAKWVLPGEPHQSNAIKLKEDYASGVVELSSPFLLVEEVANSFLKAVKLGRLSEVDAKSALEALGGLGVELHGPTWPNAARALDVACGSGLTVYDASYVILAEELKVPLITADDTLFERAGKRCGALHIRDY